jgi:hypothetical protein
LQLRDALRQLADLDQHATVWIERRRPWSPESEVLIAGESQEGGAPDPDYEYFLEVFIIRDELGLPWPDLEAYSRRVIQYAQFDA